MSGIGSKLREIRLKLQLTLKEVEERSTGLAPQWDNPAYRVSASWLDRVEREDRDLSATKLMVLATIYDLTPDQLIAWYPVSAMISARQADRISSPDAISVAQTPLGRPTKNWLPHGFLADPPPESTALLPSEDGTLPSHYRIAIIGQQDRMLTPMVPAGSIVLIDTQRRTIAGHKEWTHEFDHLFTPCSRGPDMHQAFVSLTGSPSG